MLNKSVWNRDQQQEHGKGGTPVGLKKSTEVAPIHFRRMFLDVPSTNPMLQKIHVDRGYLSSSEILIKHISSLPQITPLIRTTPRPTIVDWRNRGGWPWITSIRNQDPCEACWAFASTALVEAMVRIEHSVWCELSEGDVHKGRGAHCADLGNTPDTLNWIRDHGLADPGCFSWQTSDVPWTPTPDRSGRTVRIPQNTNVGSVDDQKNWLDTVGPLICFFNVYRDFEEFHGSAVYRKQDTIGGHPNTLQGGHYMLVVGYDDNQNCWIVKNSWGTGWGEGGYARIGYGECDIDRYAKQGLRGTNPDPWTKRHLHSGNVIESGNGAHHSNFEMLVNVGATKQIQHWWRDNSAPGFPWAKAYAPFGNDVAVCPTVTATTFNRNFECVYLTTHGRLHHSFFDQTSKRWMDGGIFGPTDAKGIPGFIQSNYGAPGNFEVVVLTSDGKLNHWWRENRPPWTWHDGGRFGQNIAFSGTTLVQGMYGKKGNLELICVLNDGRMQHWWRDDDHGFVWHPSVTFGGGVFSPPCMIEASYGARDEHANGNFELCVAVGGQIQHWWRDNQGDMVWRKSSTFGHEVQAVIGLLQSTFGFDLEMIVLRSDQRLQHYWRDGAGWHEGQIIT
ncbi:hypothetical protein PDL68_23320 [Bacillus cereus]|nr:hypothetical protein [Bacillus cereus]